MGTPQLVSKGWLILEKLNKIISENITGICTKIRVKSQVFLPDREQATVNFPWTTVIKVFSLLVRLLREVTPGTLLEAPNNCVFPLVSASAFERPNTLNGDLIKEDEHI